MAGVTSLGLRYPTIRDTINASSWQNLANDIDGALGALDVKRQKALHRPAAQVIGFSNSVNVTTTTTMTYTTEEWDTDGLANLGVNNDRLDLTAGIWLFFGECQFSGMTTVTSIESLITVNGANYTAQKVGAIDPGLIVAHAVGMLYSANDGDILRMRARWTGTGGPADVNAYLTVLRIREP